MLTEGFRKNAEELNNQIRELNKEIEATKNQGSSWFTGLLDMLGTVFTLVLPGPAKLLGLPLKFLGSKSKD